MTTALVVGLQTANAPVQELGRWDFAQLEREFKKAGHKERTPEDSKVAVWEGVRLQDIIDKALSSVSPEAKAEIDLVVLKNDSGGEALLPRSVITKYPVLIALQRDRKPLKNLQSIIPWGTKPKILEESLPLARYFVSPLTRIELASYKARYSSYLLKRRTDPSAMRGEKLFVQNCVGCHATGMGPGITEFRSDARIRSLASKGHPLVPGNPKLSEKDQRAILNYFEAYRGENPSAVSAAVQSSNPGTLRQ